MTPAIRARRLALTRGTTTIIDGLDLELEAGTRLAILGPNGIGKSTLAAALAGRGRVAEGQLELLGEDARQRKGKKKRKKKERE
jgi:ABC-type multidrug transport system ATPase subunit